MRILHIDPDDIDNPLSGGGPVRTFEINRRLARRHEITVLTPTFDGSTPELVRDGIHYRRLGRKVGDHGSSHHITFFFALPRAVRRADCDLIVEDFMPPMSATPTPLVARAPVIGSVQWFFAEMLQRRYRLPFAFGERRGVRLYRNLVVLTESMQSRLAALAPHATIRVLPNGVEDGLFGLTATVGAGILYIGRVDFEQKGVDLLLDAYARVPRSGRPPLTIAGHGYEGERAVALAARLGLGDTVRFLGRVDAAERARLLQACRFVCVPSREETFGMVIAEACAAAKPVVLFDRAPMTEVAGGGCERAPAFEVAAYAAAMARLAAAPDAEIAARGLACRAFAARFRWDGIADAQEAFYLEVADREAFRRRRRNG